jgi:hypothetical protein
MRAPVRLSRGRLQYTGQIAREAYSTWAESPGGVRALTWHASQIRVALLGRMRAARRRMWRQLVQAAQSASVADALQRDIDGFFQLATLACADFPRGVVDLRRLVVVPRLFVNRSAYDRIQATLQSQPVFAQVEGGESLRSWFALTVIAAVEAAVARAAPSPRHPLGAGDNWIVVGVNERFDWDKLVQGPRWPGHYHVLELRAASPITRAVRRAASEAVAGLETGLLRMSPKHRSNALTQATLSLDRLVKT